MEAKYLHNFFKKFEKFAKNNELILGHDKVVVAVSGGLDSVVLFYCLQRLALLFNLKLHVAHLNHKLRAQESDEDELFVKDLAFNNNVTFSSAKKNIKNYAKSHKLSIETAAREVRYQFLDSVCRKLNFSKIATGHHLDDQSETVLNNLLRGSGWKGLSGIPVKREKIIRPLLFATRQELEKVVRSAGLTYRDDQSNFQLDFRRNRLRVQLLPLLKEKFNPQISRTLVQLSCLSRESEDYLQYQGKLAYDKCLKSISEGKIILEIDRFSGYFTIIRKYVLFHLFAAAGLSQNVFSFRRMKEILLLIEERKFGRAVGIIDNWQIGVDHSGIVLYSRPQSRPVFYQFRIGESIYIPENRIRLKSEIFENDGPAEFNRDALIEFVDFQSLENHVCQIRSVQPGDRFFPLGLNHRQKLSDFFINQKIPFWDRGQTLVLVSGKDIVWVIGYRLDNRFKLTKNSKKVVKFQIVDETGKNISQPD